MNPSYKTKICATVGTVLTLFFWEHFSKNRTSWSPIGIGYWILGWFKPFFYLVGYWWAQISSFIARIDLTDVYDTFNRFWLLFVELLKTVREMAYGYGEVALQYKYPLVALGSIVLVGAIIFLYCYLIFRGYRLPFFSHLLKFFNTAPKPVEEDSAPVQRETTPEAKERKRRNSVGRNEHL